MTVGELMDKLKEYPKEAEVLVWDSYNEEHEKDIEVYYDGEQCFIDY